MLRLYFTRTFSSSHTPQIAHDLVVFLNESWTPFHAVNTCKNFLLNAGFVELDEREGWEGKLENGKKYFFTRNMSALMAFAVGKNYIPGNGIVAVAAHTDSPCPKLKPISNLSMSGYINLSLQPYGGGLWHTWFDRDLSIGGRAIVNRNETFSHELIKIPRPILRTSTLAIHLTPSEERSFLPNMQQHMTPILASELKAALQIKESDENGSKVNEPEKNNQCSELNVYAEARHSSVLIKLIADELKCQTNKIVDLELQLCDTQPSTIGGAFDEFIFSGRLDNLCSTYQSIRALIDSTNGPSFDNDNCIRMVCLFDNEEVGSQSSNGAMSTLLPESIRRISFALNLYHQNNIPFDLYERVLKNTFIISADMAHAIHPNYKDKHDSKHQPMIHQGMVIKHNANQRYATNSIGAIIFRECGKIAKVPMQEFCVRADSTCGTTVGPVLAALSGIKTIDVGCPQLSMHSIREVMGVDDVKYGYLHLKSVFENYYHINRLLSCGDK